MVGRVMAMHLKLPLLAATSLAALTFVDSAPRAQIAVGSVGTGDPRICTAAAGTTGGCAVLGTGGALPVAQGGGGATTASGIRTNLGLGGAAVLNVGTTTGTVGDGGVLASVQATANSAVQPNTAPTLSALTLTGGVTIGGSGGPTFTSGSGAPSSTQPSGSIYSRTDTAVGIMLYVSSGVGVWTPINTASTVKPDALKVAADGTDDAPSIQRAINLLGQSGGRLDFSARLYNLQSAITETNAVVWKCVESQQPKAGPYPPSGAMPASYPAGGTWFGITSTSFSPITLSGSQAQGTTFDGCGFAQQHPDPTYPAVGSVTNSWTPTAYPPVITVNNVNGDTYFRNMTWSGINEGIYADFSSRLVTDNWRSQFFTYGIEEHHSYDVNRHFNWHNWPYWADSKDVEYYTQQHMDLIRLYRVDTPFIDKIFCITCRSVVDFETDGAVGSNPGGVATKLHIGDISVDFSYSSLFIDAIGVTFTADTIEHQGQDVSTANSAIANAAPIIATQEFTGQIGRIHAEGASLGFAYFATTSSTGCDNLQLGSGFMNNSAFLGSSTTGYVVFGGTCSTGSAKSVFSISMIPGLVYGSGGAPSTFTSGGGVTLQWPAYVTQP